MSYNRVNIFSELISFYSHYIVLIFYAIALFMKHMAATGQNQFSFKQRGVTNFANHDSIWGYDVFICQYDINP